MNVIFMGTPEFAVPSLMAIVRAGYRVPLVVSVPDGLQGRGRKLAASAVKRAALESGLEVSTPESLKDPEFLDLVRSKTPHVICVVAFRILPEALYTIPSLGSFNLHGSLLPKYRGAAPINWALIRGETETGVTTFMLRAKVDTGGIILQRRVPITPEMTAGELHDAMMPVGAEAVVETLRLIESGKTRLLPQDDSAATPAPKIFRQDCRIDWHRGVGELHDRIRGLAPQPGAFTVCNGRIIKIYRTLIADPDTGLFPAKTRIDQGRLFVGTGAGTLRIIEVHPEGKRAMSAGEFLRGVRSKPEITFE